jgi:monoamine oxidase
MALDPKFVRFAAEAKKIGLSLRWARDTWYETASAYYHLSVRKKQYEERIERRDRLMLEHEMNR